MTGPEASTDTAPRCAASRYNVLVPLRNGRTLAYNSMSGATAAAAPFLCQIAMDEATLWRATLATELAFLSTGYDEPYAPVGTAKAVCDAIRPYVGELLGLWGSADPGLDMALVAVSVAFPAEAMAITAQLRDWFARSEPPLRTALGLALGFHGLADQAVGRIIMDEVGQSISWAILSGDLVAIVPDQSAFPARGWRAGRRRAQARVRRRRDQNQTHKAVLRARSVTRADHRT